MKVMNIKYWKIELFEEQKPSASIVNGLMASENKTPFFTGYSKNPVEYRLKVCSHPVRT